MVYQRHSIRLHGYDYSQNGSYFVTMCIQNREMLLGKINERKMNLNDAGKMIEEKWKEIPIFYPGCGIDEFQIMPNHMHMILIIDNSVGAGPRACPTPNKGQPQGVAPTPLSLSDIICRFKSLTTRLYITGVTSRHWLMFSKHLWQRNYYEHIIRNEREYIAIKNYIKDNPKNWEEDEMFGG